MTSKQLRLIPKNDGGDGKKHYWRVPPKLYDALNEEFHFTFDPCPYPRPEDWDGLRQDWGERNFVNPPFKAEDGGPIGRWVLKSIQQRERGKLVVLLVTSDTSTTWFAKLRELELRGAAELRFIRGRVRFLEVEDRTPGPSPMMGALIAILKPKSNGAYGRE